MPSVFYKGDTYKNLSRHFSGEDGKKNLNRHFSSEDGQMANSFVKKCLPSLTIRGNAMQNLSEILPPSS